jgi:hypothetical protein
VRSRRTRILIVRCRSFELDWSSTPEAIKEETIEPRPYTVCPSCQVELCDDCEDSIDEDFADLSDAGLDDDDDGPW